MDGCACGVYRPDAYEKYVMTSVTPAKIDAQMNACFTIVRHSSLYDA